MIMLAPIRAMGGISSWAAAVRRHWGVDLTVIDTSPPLRAPSQDLSPVLAAMGLIHGFHVWGRALTLAIRRRDVIWATTSPSIGFRVRDVPFLLIARLLGVRSILHVHGSHMPGLLGSGRLSQRWAALGIRSAAEVVVLDTKTQHHLAALTRRHIQRLPNFVELGTQVASPHSPPAKWLYVGRVAPAKGSHVLVEFASRIRLDATLTVVGPIDPAIEESFRRACGQTHVRLTGVLSPEGVRERMLAADVLLLPSHHEGFPMVVLEAMAVGLPVVSSDVGACREMLVEGHEPIAGAILPSPELLGAAEFVSAAMCVSNRSDWASSHSGGRARVSARYEADHITKHMRMILAGSAK